MSSACKDLIGNRFGRLFVRGRAESSRSGIARWECLCDCGGERIVQGNHLRTGAIQSCGCLQRESTARVNKSHGQARTPTYITWCSMVQRCTDPNCKSYIDYGARGITIDSRWLNFDAFFADMGTRPESASLERIDNNAGYSPENCKWASRVEQGNNTRRNRFLSAFGRTQTAAQWSRELNISAHTILKRIDKYKWAPERALTTP